MGGAIITFEGKTPEEVEKKLSEQVKLARSMGLSIEAQTEPEYDERKQVWWAGAKVHT